MWFFGIKYFPIINWEESKTIAYRWPTLSTFEIHP